LSVDSQNLEIVSMLNMCGLDCSSIMSLSLSCCAKTYIQQLCGFHPTKTTVVFRCSRNLKRNSFLQLRPYWHRKTIVCSCWPILLLEWRHPVVPPIC